MTEEETASAASTLAFATRQWLLGDFVGAPSAMRAAEKPKSSITMRTEVA